MCAPLNWCKWSSSLFFVLTLCTASCRCAWDEHEEGALIKAICDRVGSKYVILTTPDEDAGNDYKIMKTQKLLNEMGSLFTSILRLGTLLQVQYMDLSPRTLVVLYWDGNMSRNFIQVSNKTLGQFSWLCLSTSSYFNETELDDVSISFNSEFLYTTLEGGNIILREIYQISRDSAKITKDFGKWNASAGLVVEEEEELYNRRKDLRQIQLKYLLMNTNPLSPCTEQWKGDPLVLECIFFILWNDLSYTFNFTTEFIITNVLYDNGTRGTTTPSLDKISSLQADTGTEPLVITSTRLDYCSFLWPITWSKIIIYTMVPDVKIDISSYTQPLDAGLWMMTLTWLVIMSAVMPLSKYLVVRLIRRKRFAFLKDCADEAMAPFSSLCSQPANIEETERYLSFLILILIIKIVPLCILPAYSGALISSLTDPPLIIPFVNFKEFIADGTYKMMAVKNFHAYTYLQENSAFLSVRKAKLTQSDAENPDSDLAAYEMVCRERVSFVSNQPSFLTTPFRCKLFSMEENLGIFYASMAVRKNYPFSELFNRILQRRVMSGLFNKDMDRTAMNKLKHGFEQQTLTVGYHRSVEQKTVDPFGFDEIFPIIMIFLVGWLAAAAVFACEILYFYKKDNPFGNRYDYLLQRRTLRTP